jgi:hypothetical protein
MTNKNVKSQMDFLRINFKKIDKELTVTMDSDSSGETIRQFADIMEAIKDKTYYEDENVKIHICGITLLDSNS